MQIIGDVRRVLPAGLIVLCVIAIPGASWAQPPKSLTCSPAPAGVGKEGALLCVEQSPSSNPVSAPAPLAQKPVERNRFVEVLGGMGGEVVAFPLAVGAVAAVDGASNDEAASSDESDELGGDIAGAITASILTYGVVAPFTVAAGVVLTSRADLSYGDALLGAALGILPCAALAAAGASALESGESAVGGVLTVGAIGTGFFLGPILASSFPDDSEDEEQQSAADPAKVDHPARAVSKVRIAPALAVSADGSGGSVGLSGRF